MTQSCLGTHSDAFEREKQLENGLGSGQAGRDGWEECTEPAVLPGQDWSCDGDVGNVAWHRR